MKSLSKIVFLFTAVLLLSLSACTNDEVTSISLTKQELNLKVGKPDSLNVVVNFTGDINKQPVTLSVADPKIASAAFGISQDETKTTKTSFTKNIVITALSTGSTSVTILVGSKTTKLTVTITQTSLTFNQIAVINYGPVFYDLHDIDNNYYSVNLTSGTASYNAITKKYSGTGKILVMNVMTPLTYTNIAPGDYNSANTAGPFTFFPGSSDGTYYYPAFIFDMVNGARTFQIISDGTFSVSKNNDGTFLIVGDVNSDTDGIVHFSYNGSITPEDKQTKGQTSTFTSGSLYYYADTYYKSGLSNTYKLDLRSTVDSVSLLINTSLTAKDSIPSGKYPLITLPLTTTNQLKPYTIIPGDVYNDGTYLYYMGSWYWGIDNLRLESGFADISHVGNNYSISYQLYNHFGIKFSGVYTGSLNYINKASSNVKAVQIKGASKVRSSNKKTIANKTIGKIALTE